MMMGILIANARESSDRERGRGELKCNLFLFFPSFFSQCKNDREPCAIEIALVKKLTKSLENSKCLIFPVVGMSKGIIVV